MGSLYYAYMSNERRNHVYNRYYFRCVEEQDYLAIEADKLNNSVKTLQEWGNIVIEQNKGDKDEWPKR